MTKSNCIYLIAPFPIFQSDAVSAFEVLDNEHTMLLYKNLFLNYHEIFSALPDIFTIVYCLDEKDRDFLPDEIAGHTDLVFYNHDFTENLTAQLSEKYITQHQYNLFVSSNSIMLT
ncbi:MAG: hypothetical protein K8H86_06685, partial [Ignavibacteriaceae bacterium]|nr:hypothetical protein [Ignavibacteriaceae bacterium]